MEKTIQPPTMIALNLKTLVWVQVIFKSDLQLCPYDLFSDSNLTVFPNSQKGVDRQNNNKNTKELFCHTWLQADCDKQVKLP